MPGYPALVELEAPHATEAVAMSTAFCLDCGATFESAAALLDHQETTAAAFACENYYEEDYER